MQEKKIKEWDACKNGIFLVIVYNDKDIKRINNIQDIAKETAEYYKVSIKIVIVDARTDNKESASKI